MKLQIMKQELSLCKIENVDWVDMEDELWFLAKTDEELSLVCSTSCVPTDALVREDGWRALRIQGMLDFGLVGVLAEIADLLAKERVSIFAISTYNTDYILTKKENFHAALSILKKNGYEILQP